MLKEIAAALEEADVTVNALSDPNLVAENMTPIGRGGLGQHRCERFKKHGGNGGAGLLRG